MALPDILNEKIADQTVEKTLRRERERYVQYFKGQDGKIYAAGDVTEISQTNLQNRISELTAELQRLKSFIDTPEVVAPSAPPQVVEPVAPVAPMTPQQPMPPESPAIPTIQ